MSTAFLDNPMDNKNLSDAIKDAFPNSLSKRMEKERKVHIVGIEERELPPETVMDQLDQERRKNTELTKRITELKE